MKLDLPTNDDLQNFKKELLKEISETLKKEGNDAERLLKSREVCAMLRISAGKLQAMRDNRKIPFIKWDAIIVYRLSDIRDLIIKNLKNNKGLASLYFLLSFTGII